MTQPSTFTDASLGQRFSAGVATPMDIHLIGLEWSSHTDPADAERFIEELCGEARSEIFGSYLARPGCDPVFRWHVYCDMLRNTVVRKLRRDNQLLEAANFDLRVFRAREMFSAGLGAQALEELTDATLEAYPDLESQQDYASEKIRTVLAALPIATAFSAGALTSF